MRAIWKFSARSAVVSERPTRGDVFDVPDLHVDPGDDSVREAVGG